VTTVSKKKITSHNMKWTVMMRRRRRMKNNNITGSDFKTLRLPMI